MRAAVLGSPVAHSRSPVLHRAAYAALGLDDWRYDAIECAEADLPGLVEGLGPEWAGLSLTMPLKRVALDVAKEVSDRAAAARLGVAVALAPYHAVPDRLGEFPLLVSTVPAGAADRFAGLPFRADQVVFDVLYHPWPTPLAAAALAAGATVVGGLELLLQQAVGQVELMTGCPAPVEAMRTALYAAAD